MHVWVGYATAHGSTRDSAQRIGMRLSAAELHVDVRAMREVQAAPAYEAFVLGSAIHSQAWLPEAKDFVRLDGVLLGIRPVWLFSVGMPGALRGLACETVVGWKRVPGPTEVLEGL
ncbi:flavodoxin domain-containing protein [Streptomyces atriruber]|uniref:flavodoxin domain-containing protein n=1 Tax=Streptomyces atriruber TaxID=545121 RepID=UPI0006E2F97F|nr:flavodoxin domain-containing protein [Streptomyces atriruber]